jgi:DNA-binding transcriptional LysR family regulator
MLSFMPTQLRVLLTVVEQGSARAAADRLRVSPAAISSSLATLQRAVGTKLFEKDGRGLRLTGAGESFLRDVRRIVALSAGAVASARATAHDAPQALRIGGVMTTGDAFLGDLLARFMTHAPDAAIELQVVRRVAMWDLIAERKLDIGIAEVPPDLATLRPRAMRRNDYVVAAASGQRFTKAALANALWLLREPGAGTRAATEALLHEYGLSPRTCTIGSPAAIIHGIRAGVGVSLLSRDLIAEELRAGRVQIVRTPFTPRPRPWYFITAADRDPSPEIERFLAFALQIRAFTLPE